MEKIESALKYTTHGRADLCDMLRAEGLPTVADVIDELEQSNAEYSESLTQEETARAIADDNLSDKQAIMDRAIEMLETLVGTIGTMNLESKGARKLLTESISAIAKYLE